MRRDSSRVRYPTEHLGRALEQQLGDLVWRIQIDERYMIRYIKPPFFLRVFSAITIILSVK